MKTIKTVQILIVALAATLLSIPAAAQLTLGAKAKADTKGADATATSETETAGEPAAEPAPEPVAEEVAPTPIAYSEPIVSDAPVADAKVGGDGVAGWDNGFYIKTLDDNFKLKINGTLKSRFTLYNQETPVIGDDGEPGTNHTNYANFAVPYLRFALSGNIFSPRFTYAVIYDFATSGLIEGWGDFAFIQDKLHLTVGEMKRPFSRDYINSTTANNAIFGSIGELGEGDDTGIMLSNNYRNVKGLEWAVGVFNRSVGSPYTNVNGADMAPAVVGRIGYNNGVNGYVASDFDGGPFRFGVALSASTEFDHDGDNFSSHYLGLDGIIKVQGLSVSAAFYLENIAGNGATGGAGFWDDAQMARIGTFVKAAYLINKRFEPMARYGMVHMYDLGDDINEEITGGFNWYIHGQNIKWETNVSLLTHRLGTDADPQSVQDILVATQLQFMF